MARLRIPFSRRRDEEAPRSQPDDGALSAGTAPAATGARPDAPGARPDASAPRTAPARPTPPAQPPDPHTRIDGLRAWLGQLDRRLGLRTYVLGAIGLLALAAAVVALVLVLQLKRDAATEGDVRAVQHQISGVQRSATHAAQQSVQSLNRRLTDLEGRVNRLSSSQTTSRRELQVVQDDIKELRRELASAASRSGGAASAPAGGAAGAPAGGAASGAGGTAPSK